MNKMVLVISGCHNKIPETGWIKEQTFIFQQFQSLDGSQRSGCQQHRVLLRALFPACRLLIFSLCINIYSFLGDLSKEISLPPSLFSYKDTDPIRLGPIFVTSFNLNYLLKALSPNAVSLSVRTLSYKFWRDTVQSIAVLISCICQQPLVLHPPFPKIIFHLKSMATNNKFNKNVNFLKYSSLGSFVCLHPKIVLGKPSTAEIIGKEVMKMV